MRWKLKRRKQDSGLQTTESIWIRIRRSLKFVLTTDLEARARPGVARTVWDAGLAIVGATPVVSPAGIRAGAGRCVRLWIIFAMTQRRNSNSLVLNCSGIHGLRATPTYN